MTKVLFKRKTSDEIANLPVEDGALIYNHETGQTYLDYGEERIPTGGGMPTGDTYPIGAIAPYGGETAPTNWLICDGSAISRTTYADLFEVIGTSFGSGDGSTTFNLPDLRSRIPLGKDSRDEDFDTIGETYGEKEHTLTIEEMPSHTHIERGSYENPSGYDNTNLKGKAYSDSDCATSTGSTGGGEAHNIVQPSLVTNYIIKAIQSSGTVANVSQTQTSSDTDTYSCNYINDALLDVYSTDEIKTNKVWIDDKPIYRKVFTFSNITLSNGVTVNTPIANIDILVKHQIYYHNTSDDLHFSFPLVEITGNTLGYHYTNGTIIFRGLGSWGASNLKYIDIILEYTKTTD